MSAVHLGVQGGGLLVRNVQNTQGAIPEKEPAVSCVEASALLLGNSAPKERHCVCPSF